MNKCGECAHLNVSDEDGFGGWCMVVVPMWVDPDSGHVNKDTDASDCESFEKKDDV